jgi:hypothetical protein
MFIKKSVATEKKKQVLISTAERPHVAGNNKTYLKVHIIFTDFSQIWIISTDIHSSPQYQM